MREFLQKPAGKAVAVILVLIGIGAAAYAIYSSTSSSVASQVVNQMYVEASTGQAFPHALTKGEIVPIVGPSGKKDGYPSEKCFWTADGHPKATPDYVLMNDFLGKPGPTFCPVCHRLVVEHNPMATEGGRVPPTEQEYAARRGGTQ